MRPASEITVGQVVRHTEPDMRMTPCETCVIRSVCCLPQPFLEATRAFLAVLDGYSLQDVINSSRGLEAFLSAPDLRPAPVA